MADPLDQDRDWRRYIRAISEAGDIDPAAVAPNARLVEDLGLDSLALVELITTLADEKQLDILAARLEEQAWSGVTVRAFYDHAVKAVPRPERLVIRREPG